MARRADANRCVVLLGFMGAGKTTVGRALAALLHCDFFDLDAVIEQRERKSVAEIFASSGETEFRRTESAALAALLQDQLPKSDLVIALGGGAFVQKENRMALAAAGAITILLEAPLEELRRRCSSESKVRPLAQQEARFNELFAARRADYALARFKVQTMGKSVEEISAEIARLLNAAKLEVEE
ncbi:MAG TPA: shikimate kinase [Candidatus Angelobacter sp.]|nr:shikimate kinase [Candidatus Angelobacter sp.]